MSLEKIRENYGNEKFKKQFLNILNKNKRYAIILLNDENLTFSTFFLLIPIIKQYNLIQYLSTRNKIAINICRLILQNKRNMIKISDSNLYIISMEWMVKSAENNQGMSETFDEIIDICIAELLIELNDNEILKPAVELAFTRNKKHQYNHDLIWTLFKTNDVNLLELIIEHLKLSDLEDNEFANELLNNAMGNEVLADENNKYESYVKWLDENKPYISFTGEGYNISSQPNFFKLDTVLKNKNKPIIKEESAVVKSNSKVEIIKEEKNSNNILNYNDKWIAPKQNKTALEVYHDKCATR